MEDRISVLDWGERCDQYIFAVLSFVLEGYIEFLGE